MLAAEGFALPRIKKRWREGANPVSSSPVRAPHKGSC